MIIIIGKLFFTSQRYLCYYVIPLIYTFVIVNIIDQFIYWIIYIQKIAIPSEEKYSIWSESLVDKFIKRNFLLLVCIDWFGSFLRRPVAKARACNTKFPRCSHVARRFIGMSHRETSKTVRSRVAEEWAGFHREPRTVETVWNVFLSNETIERGALGPAY